MMFPTKFPQSSLLTGKWFLTMIQSNDPKIEGADACKSASRQPCSLISTESRFYVQVDTGRLHRTDDLTSATCRTQPQRFVSGLAESFPLSLQSLFLPACFQRNRQDSQGPSEHQVRLP